MSLIEGNKTSDFRTPGGSSTSFSHTQDVGSDGALVALLTSATGNITSVTYGGQSLTLINQSIGGAGFSDRWSVWELKSPPTGSNTLTINYNVSLWDTVSNMIYSFTGSDGVGNHSVNNTPAVDQTTGTTVPTDWNHNIGMTIKGGISPSLTSGTKQVKAQTNWGSAIIRAVEVKEASVTPPPTRGRRIIIN